MKLTSSIVAVAILLAAPAGLLAADTTNGKVNAAKQSKVAKAKKAPAKPEKQPEQVAMTGSYIKQDIHRAGTVTDGPNPVVVLDNDAIRNSGAGDLRELLVLRGLSR